MSTALARRDDDVLSDGSLFADVLSNGGFGGDVLGEGILSSDCDGTDIRGVGSTLFPAGLRQKFPES